MMKQQANASRETQSKHKKSDVYETTPTNNTQIKTII